MFFEDALCIENISTIDPEIGLLENQTIIIKAGKNAKWYLKYYELSKLDEAIETTKQYRDTRRATMYVITWS